MSYLDRDTYGMYRDRDQSGPGPHLMGAGTLMGEDVYNRQDEDLGDIKEFMLDMSTGQVAYAVLSFGGILGMGDKLFAVPFEALQLDTVNKRFILDIDKATLENAPGFDKDRWPDMADQEFTRTVRDFYGSRSGSAGNRMMSSGSMMGQGTSTLQSDDTYGSSMGGNLGGGSGNLNR